ncbi:hypothetical protein PUV54_14055 [Hyphococcus flavus]|uniref:Lipoprotein n=1 Tax=Hyphococcus flavus TaxID=1866326 RepID=A0AAF0CBI8_9PROT|nr:hypothetical protein [Hyphococcus flavus]WDI31075.1 hypothetical protein PUV54_14055 [Hyphococcus flavus]
MTRRLKLMTSLSTIAAVSALSLAGCGGEGEGEGAEGESEGTPVAASGESEGLSAESEGEGESEGGEGESEGAVASGDPATDDIEYLRLLGLVRGHLVAFYELYQGGETTMALMHVKHPESELYASLAPAIAARGLSGFADELTTLANAAEVGGEVTEPYSAVITQLNSHAPGSSVAQQLLSISQIVRTAGDEFDIGVEDNGSISNAHEYQDAYGFLIASREILSGISTTDINAVEAIEMAQEQIALALGVFESLTASETEGEASTLYGAAARIEIAARGLM